MTLIQLSDYKFYKEELVHHFQGLSFNAYIQDSIKSEEERIKKAELKKLKEENEEPDGHEWTDLDEDGNLQYCHKCMGMEGSLPTHCPEETMIREISDRVYAGGLDFIRGRGWVHEPSPMGRSMLYSRAVNIYRGKELRLNDSEFCMSTGISKRQYKKEMPKLLAEITKYFWEGKEE